MSGWLWALAGVAVVLAVVFALNAFALRDIGKIKRKLGRWP